MLCRGLLYVVCWYVGVLPLKVGSCGRSRPQDVDFALRRSCLVVKITMYIHFCAYMCTFFLVVAFRDARFLSGLYGRFSYIVHYLVNLRVTGLLTGYCFLTSQIPTDSLRDRHPNLSKSLENHWILAQTCCEHHAFAHLASLQTSDQISSPRIVQFRHFWPSKQLDDSPGRLGWQLTGY